LPAAWAQFSTGIYRLDNRLMVVLDVGKLLALGETT
jgi:chemotaxis signal transduction protein